MGILDILLQGGQEFYEMLVSADDLVQRGQTVIIRYYLIGNANVGVGIDIELGNFDISPVYGKGGHSYALIFLIPTLYLHEEHCG
jgi:hypothetical protein